MELKKENLVGKKLRILREMHNYTQEYVAEQLNLKQKAYSNLETGEVSLNLEKSEHLAKLYKMDIIDLLAYLHSSEKFVIYNNRGTSSLIGQGEVNIHNHGLVEKERSLYEGKISLLEEKIKFMEEKLKYFEEKK